MEKIIADQLKERDYIANHFKNFKSKGQAKMTYDLAKQRIRRLDELLRCCVARDERLRELEDVDYDHDYFKIDFLFEVEEHYDEVRDLYIQYLKTVEPASPTPQVETPPAHPVVTQGHSPHLGSLIKSLPPITIEPFSGETSKWPHFRNMFTSMIHSQDLPNALKMNYLRSYLQGEALDVIKSLPMDDYEASWDTLKLFYENERRLVHNHLSELFSVKPMRTESYLEVKRILTEVFTPFDALTALNRPTKYWADIVVFLIVRLMDVNTRKDWEKNLGKGSQTPTLDRLKSFLQSQALIYEAVERSMESDTTPSVTNKKASNASHQASVNNTQQNSPNKSSPKKEKNKKERPVPKCSVCGEAHYLNQCAAFKQKSVAERKVIVADKKLCFNCFGSHSLSNCNSKFTCFTCKGKHHTLLHNPGKEKPNPPNLGNNLNQNAFTPGNTSQMPQLQIPQNSQKQFQPQTSSQLPMHNQVQSLNQPLIPNNASFNGATVDSDCQMGVLLGTAMIVIEGPNHQKIKARALIDNCSQPSFISQKIVDRLQLSCTSTHAPVSSVGGVQSVTGKSLARFTIRPHFPSKFCCEMKALVVPRVCSYTPPQSRHVSKLSYLLGLNLADPKFMDDVEIDVLLGADIYSLILQQGIARGEFNEPIATATLLGYVITGPIPLSTNVTNLTTLHSFHCAEDDSLSEIVQSFWRQEELPLTKLLTPDEEECENHYENHVKRDDDGRYNVKLPFRKPISEPLGDSYRKATAMLKRMEEKFVSDPEFKKLYFEFIQDYITSGHMILIQNDSPLRKPIENSFILPHHGVLRLSSSTTKLRTVFNGSSKTCSKISLNELLHTGSNLLPELPDLISAWRLYKFAFVADIKQMFRQIRLNKEDIHYQAIVWRFNPDDPIQLYYLTSVTYGLVCSPFLATRTLRQLASDYQSVYPTAAEIVSKECYMDDMLSGGHTMQETFEKQTQLIKILKEGGFELRKWLSNEPQVLSQLPKDHLATDPSAIFEAPSSFAVLGLKWQARDDIFSFELNYDPIEGFLKKRTALSKIAQIFDPMGWLAPIIVSAKIFMQSLWLLKCGWDDPLPSEYVERWEAWTSLLPKVNSLKIPRFVQYSPAVISCEIHGFADASGDAVSAVIYLRIIGKNDTHCSIQMAKTKVAPLKKLSTPKLELLGAFILSKLISHYGSKIPVKIDAIHLWSDSKDVLYWLRSHPSKWQTFVANKCSAIQSLLPSAFWHYVKSAENPADVASRGIRPDLLSDHPLWWHGPPWLTTSRANWPTVPDDLGDHKPLEEKKTKMGLVTASAVCLITPERRLWEFGAKYSSLSTLCRVTARILRFVYKLSRKVATRKNVNSSFKFHDFLDFSEISSDFISTKELHNSKLLWIFLNQQAYFVDDIKNISHQREVSKPLRKLDPILKDGFLIVGGRLDQSLISYRHKHPFILHSDCFFSQLVIRYAHARTLHGGVQLTLATVRTEFWLIKGRQAVRKVLNDCKVCVKYAGKTPLQKMGDLPSLRVNPAPPFAHSGVDYAGPYQIRLTKTRGGSTLKGYVCLFVCLVTRGIHLELAEDYTSEAFIAAFHRFTSRWGHCRELISDQGPNFVGADPVLHDMFRQNSEFVKEVCPYLALEGTQWTWNPPGAPHFGGIWESGVKSTKHHLRRVVGDTVQTFSEMSTLLSRIGACLNSRPLLPLTDDVSDFNFLTPAHFLIHRKSYLVPEPDYTLEKIPAGRYWQLVSQRMQHFWTRWRNEYLTALQPRNRWTKATRSFQPGDVVFIRDENTPPGSWPLARVVETWPDRQGVNRVCDVRTAKSQYRRPSIKLVLLVPVDNEKPQPLVGIEASSANLVLLQAAE